jgi:hypothetical protein
MTESPRKIDERTTMARGRPSGLILLAVGSTPFGIVAIVSLSRSPGSRKIRSEPLGKMCDLIDRGRLFPYIHEVGWAMNHRQASIDVGPASRHLL